MRGISKRKRPSTLQQDAGTWAWCFSYWVMVQTPMLPTAYCARPSTMAAMIISSRWHSFRMGPRLGSRICMASPLQTYADRPRLRSY
jgi:hypothetical protein